MTVYDMNKLAYAAKSAMTPASLEMAKDKICDFLCQSDSKYFMMLNNENHYYTLYVYKYIKNPIALSEEVVDVAKTLGKIKGIEVLDDHVEFWIQANNECAAYLFFEYDKGVIEV